MDIVPKPLYDHREDREAGAIVYPVYSRRSGGLSIGINLFPDKKLCSFDCPYCEVFPFNTEYRFSLKAMERGLRQQSLHAQTEIKDFSFSGNGEPTLAPLFLQALEHAASLRDELAPNAALVLITNGSTLTNPYLFEQLVYAACGSMALDIWLKIDAGTESWYRAIDRAPQPFSVLTDSFRRFAARAPFTVQTMLCSIQGQAPDQEEARAWEQLILELVRPGKEQPNRQRAATADVNKQDAAAGSTDKQLLPVGPRRIHIYGKARPAPEDPLAEALPLAYLEERAASLRDVLSAAAVPIPVSVFE